jgi:photosystem II stability/assembly factor-like uncharacterized protein
VYALARPGRAGRGEPAAELLRSSDAGRTFARVSWPVVRAPSGAVLPVRALTFINPADGFAIIGTPGQHQPLLMTVNGARSWHRIWLSGRGSVWSVAGRARGAYALVLACGRTLECRDPRLYHSAAGSLHWVRAAALGTRGAAGAGGIGMTGYGRSVWLTVGNGIAPQVGLLRSDDSGHSFQREAALNAIACWAAATSSRVVWLSCSEGMTVSYRRLTAGRTHPRLLPVIGAGTGNSFLEPLSDDLVYFGTAVGAHAGLSLSRDAGRSFTRTGPLPGPSSGISTSVTFLSVRDGLALVPGSTLFRTTDSGASWTKVYL